MGALCVEAANSVALTVTNCSLVLLGGGFFVARCNSAAKADATDEVNEPVRTLRNTVDVVLASGWISFVSDCFPPEKNDMNLDWVVGTTELICVTLRYEADTCTEEMLVPVIFSIRPEVVVAKPRGILTGVSAEAILCTLQRFLSSNQSSICARDRLKVKEVARNLVKLFRFGISLFSLIFKAKVVQSSLVGRAAVLVKS